MKTKAILIGLLLAAVGGAASFGESFRLGGSAGTELLDRPTLASIRREFDEGTNLLSGMYWEVLPGHLGFGMTYLVDFQKQASPYPGLDYLWFVDWVGSFDLRYHFVQDFFLDPFLEAGLGNAGRVDITSYEAHGLPGTENPLQLSVFAQVGGGLAFRLPGLHFGARLLWRPLNEVPPGTQFPPYPLKNFRADLFGGFSL
jgi:hypothetical protein